MRLLAGVLVVLAVLSLLAAMASRRGGSDPASYDTSRLGRGLANGLLLLGAFVLVVFAVVVLRRG